MEMGLAGGGKQIKNNFQKKHGLISEAPYNVIGGPSTIEKKLSAPGDWERPSERGTKVGSLPGISEHEKFADQWCEHTFFSKERKVTKNGA